MSPWALTVRQWQGARRYQEDDAGNLRDDAPGEGQRPALLMVLADGMGGEVGGATASRCVVRSFLCGYGEAQGGTAARLEACLEAATRALRERVRTDPRLEGMGSTVVAAVYDGQSVWWLSAGDSPMWRFAGGQLERLNADHSMAPVLDRLAEVGELTRDEALGDRRRHMLRSALTGEEVELVDRAHRVCRLAPGDYLLLASDGLQTLSEGRIAALLGSVTGGVEAVADALLAAVRAAGRPHQDNVTFLLLGSAAEAGDT